jgi:hypothetical protein
MYFLIHDFVPTRSDEEQAKRYRVGICPRLGPRGARGKYQYKYGSCTVHDQYWYWFHG